jgi:hypothetical protein
MHKKSVHNYMPGPEGAAEDNMLSWSFSPSTPNGWMDQLDRERENVRAVENEA